MAFMICQPTHATRQADSLITALNGAVDPQQQANALLEVARQLERSKPGESLAHARNALRFARSGHDRLQIHAVLAHLRGMQHHFGAQDDFLSTAIQALEIAQAISDPQLMADDLQWLSLAYEQMGAMERALEMSRKAFFLLGTTGDSAAIGRGKLHLIKALVAAGHFAEVIEQSNKALAFFAGMNDSAGQALTWAYSAKALMAQGKFADALPLLHRADRTLMVTDLHPERFQVLADIADAYTVLGQFDRARDFLGTATGLVEQLGLRSEKPRLLGICSRVDEGMGDLEGALRAQRALTALEDSLFNERVAERMAGLQALFQLGQKEKDYEALKERNASNEDQIATSRLRDRYWLAAFLLLLLLLGYSSWSMIARRRNMIRIQMKNAVISQQAEEIHRKNLELERQNLRLAETLISEDEKNLLLKEIHHRVKNNLQIVSTLLRLQVEHQPDPHIAEMMSDSQNRIRAMALVHEHLYRHGDLTRINVQQHMEVLVGSVLQCHDVHDRIAVEVKAELQRATLDTLIPLSLLVNELVTNSAKHAYPEGRNGKVRLLLRPIENGSCELYYSDDGIGMDEQTMYRRDSFGLGLIETLAAQLDGDLRLIHGDGTTVLMVFKPIELRTLPAKGPSRLAS